MCRYKPLLNHSFWGSSSINSLYVGLFRYRNLYDVSNPTDSRGGIYGKSPDHEANTRKNVSFLTCFLRYLNSHTRMNLQLADISNRNFASRGEFILYTHANSTVLYNGDTPRLRKHFSAESLSCRREMHLKQSYYFPLVVNFHNF